MTVLAATALDVDTAPVEAAPPALPQHSVLAVVHDHDWRLVQVEYDDGACIKEYSCAGCEGVWFA